MSLRLFELELDASRRQFFPALVLAWQDILQGVAARDKWQMLGTQDIKQRYRRSVLGPFWLTLSTGIMVAALGFLYAELFHQPVTEYLPFVAAGMIVWLFVSSMINEGCFVFAESERMIKQIKLPLTLYVCRIVWRNNLVLLHNCLILIPIVFMVHNFQLLPWLTIPFAIVFLSINGVFIGIILGILSTRYRDLPPIIASIIQVGFFLTPIMWKPEILTSRAWFVDTNPFYHCIEIIRAPILGEGIPLFSWGMIGIMTVVMGVVAMGLLLKYRHRVAYWV
ncbi:MAG: ABC transporter permease [Cellvibrionales bacterium]|nr:ABC transporter permease [Cellvibrionales bacterium]